MKAFLVLLLGLLLLGNLAFMGALSLHFVQSPAGFTVVPKGQTSLLDTRVDTRGWTASDLRDHAAVVADINRAGKYDLISHVTSPVTTATPPAPTRKTPEVSDTPDKSIFDFTK